MENLVVGSQSGGSVNRYAPIDIESFYDHIQHDVLPKVYCCPLFCLDYYSQRPSDDGKRYRPPPPGIHHTLYCIGLLQSHSRKINML